MPQEGLVKYRKSKDKKNNSTCDLASQHGHAWLSCMKPSADQTAVREWTAIRCAGLDDMRTQNILFWQEQGGSAIRKAAWDIVLDYWKANNLNPNELRFCRSVTSVRRS
jgi:hypothetical protein